MGIFTEGWNPFRTPIRETIGGLTGSAYLGGKEGYLPNWKLPTLKIKDTPVSEVFSAEGYKAGGEWWRKAITSRVGGFATGLLGTGKLPAKDNGKASLPFGVEYPAFWEWKPPTAEEIGAMAKGSIPKIDIPEFPKIPKIEIPEFPTFDLAGLGAGVGAGLAGMGGIPQMPQMPSFTDEEGKPNLVLIAAIAAGGIYLISKR